MASRLNLYNRALLKLGQPTINAPDQAVGRAVVVHELFPGLRDDELRGHLWNFAIRRARLDPAQSAPASGAGRAFPLPTDCLRLVEVNGRDQQSITIESDAVLADGGGPLEIVYVARIEEVAQFPADFVELLTLRLAIEAAPTLGASGQTEERLRRDYRFRRGVARTVDAQVGRQPIIEVSEWEGARR